MNTHRPRAGEGWRCFLISRCSSGKLYWVMGITGDDLECVHHAHIIPQQHDGTRVLRVNRKMEAQCWKAMEVNSVPLPQRTPVNQTQTYENPSCACHSWSGKPLRRLSKCGFQSIAPLVFTTRLQNRNSPFCKVNITPPSKVGRSNLLMHLIIRLIQTRSCCETGLVN